MPSYVKKREELFQRRVDLLVLHLRTISRVLDLPFVGRLFIREWVDFKEKPYKEQIHSSLWGGLLAAGRTRSYRLLVVNRGKRHLWCIGGLTAVGATHSSLLFGSIVKGLQWTPKSPHGKDSTATIRGVSTLGYHMSEEIQTTQALMQEVFSVAANTDYHT